MTPGAGPLPLPRLVVITDWSRGRERLMAALEQVCAGLGPRVAVQHRHPEALGRDFLEEARLLGELCERTGSHLFVNGRLDVALLLDAHVHLPAHGPSAAEVRPHLRTDRWVSVAVHDAEEARAVAGSASGGASFALVSPVFGAGSKPGDARVPLGVEGFEALARLLPCPAHALGGVDEQTAKALRGRAAGLASVTGVLDAADPLSAAKALLGIVAPP